MPIKTALLLEIPLVDGAKLVGTGGARQLHRLCTHLLHRLHGRWRVLVAAEVYDDPGDITKEGNRDGGDDKGQQGLDHAQRDDIVPALRTVT